ncbi:MAG: protoporphyrinogen oxidase [Planctomycetota bacterium]|nr:protoporphyrinogen oxidase [Planctomycetota bacterium]
MTTPTPPPPSSAALDEVLAEDRTDKPWRIVIVGAGIAGLAAARAASDTARAEGRLVEILVIEREAVVGGKAQTLVSDGWRLEAGPTGYLDSEPAMDPLVKAAGLTKLAADDAAARRFLVREGQLKEIQAHPVKFFTSGVLSPIALARLATEPFWPRIKTEAGVPGYGSGIETADGVDTSAMRDESVWDFARRRLGRQAADRLIAPMVLGVFAGDAKRTSLPAAFPRMAELEAEYGSLVKAMFALKKRKGAASGGPAGPSGKLTSFARGLDQLPRGLAERGEARGDFTVRCGIEVREVGHDGDCWRLLVAPRGLATEELHADSVVLAGESFSAAELVSDVAPELASELASIATPPVAVVGLGYGPAALAAVPKGFGALIERGQNIRILGVLWDTHLFPGRSPDGTLLMRCMVGGATDTESGSLTDDELIEITKLDLARLFSLSGPDAEPVFTEVVRWPRAIPQYELGHLARVARIRHGLAQLSAERPGLFLAGNYLDGVAFAKAAKSGLAAGQAAVRV